MFARCKNRLARSIICGACCLLPGITGWKLNKNDTNSEWIRTCLLQSFNQAAIPLKKWEISVGPEGFFRLKKYFAGGKQEYFSFNFKRLKDIKYEGTNDSGSVVFTTINDDIIVQTYNDPKGNIDSMSTVLALPVLNMSMEKLDSLRNMAGRLKERSE